MKRSNFTFLICVLSVLMWSSVWGQTAADSVSKSCKDVNIAVSAACTFTFDAATVDALGLAAKADEVIFTQNKVQKWNSVFPGTGSLSSSFLPGAYVYSLYTKPTDTTGLVFQCWGNVNIENKNVPKAKSNSSSVMCGLELRKPISVSDALDSFKLDACSVPVRNFVATTFVQDSLCTGTTGGKTKRIITSIRGEYLLKGEWIKFNAYNDTINQMALDTNGMQVPEKVVIPCEDVSKVDTDKDGVLDASEIADYYDDKSTKEINEGLAKAYLHLRKDTDTVLVIDSTTYSEYYNDTIDTMVAEGSLWVLKKVIRHSDSIGYDTTEKYNYFVVPIYKFDDKLPGDYANCNLKAKCADMKINLCGVGYTVMRTWTVVDLCTWGSYTYTSAFDVVDDKAPEITEVVGKPANDTFVVSTLPWVCAAEFTVPAVKSKDNCNKILDPVWTSEEGRFENGKIVDLWQGVHKITVTVSDECGNKTSKDMWVMVMDNVKPVPVVHDRIQVTLTGQGSTAGTGIAKAYWQAFDNGSHDAGCGDVEICVIRMEDYNAGYLGKVTIDGITYDKYKSADLCHYDGVDKVVTKDKWGAVISTTDVKYVLCKDFVKFCCDDIGKDNMVVVVVKDAKGNTNTAMVAVDVVDKSASVIVCPADAWIDCDQINPDPNVTGWATAGGICGKNDVKYTDESSSGCNGGAIIRTWFIDANDNAVADSDEKQCVQKINIRPFDGLDPWTIKWPLHYDGRSMIGWNLECKEDGSKSYVVAFDKDIKMQPHLDCKEDVMDRPTWCNPKCGTVGYSVTEEVFEASEACKKVIRRHTIIDWCNYNPNGLSQKGNNVDDDNDHGDKYELISSWLAGSKCAKCEDDGNPTDYIRYQRLDPVTGVALSDLSFDRDGYYTFDQVIKVVDNIAPEIIAADTVEVNVTGGRLSKNDNTPCSAEETITATVVDYCGGDTLELPAHTPWTVKASNQTSAVSKTGLEVSMTVSGKAGDVVKVDWTAKDGCNNIGRKTTVVIFVDKKAPTPICIQNISTAVMQNGAVTLWASDFDLGSYDNCKDVVISFSADEIVTNLDLSCDDYPLWEGNLYAHQSGDEGKVFDFCAIAVSLNDKDGVCGNSTDTSSAASAIVKGALKTDAIGAGVESASVRLTGFRNNGSLTGATGEFNFVNTPLNYAYDLSASRNDGHDNGVTTNDITLLQRHVLGIKGLTSAYKIIAGDVNNDEVVDIKDITAIRKLILGISTELPGGSWKFVDASQTFQDVANPFPAKEIVKIANLSGDIANQNFVGIKLGDINGDAKANSSVEVRSASSKTVLTATNAVINAGERVSVALRGSDVTSLQFTLAHAGLKLISVEGMDVTKDNFASHTDATTFAINVNESQSAELNVTFEATTNVELSKVLSINSSITKALAYDAKGNASNVELALANSNNAFELYQNSPNPFGEVTNIGFSLLKAEAATLTVMDVTGKVLYSKNISAKAGRNTISVSKKEIGASGVMYYRLQTDNDSRTMKMILID